MNELEKEESLFTPYNALFKREEYLQLKNSNDLLIIYNRWTKLIEDEGFPVDWCPSMEILNELKNSTFLVESVIFFHGGVPLYVLLFNLNNKEYSIRLCESCLEKIDENKITL